MKSFISPQARRLSLHLTAVTVAVLVVALAVTSWSGIRLVEPVFTPELDRKAVTVGQTLARQLDRATGFGIPLARLPGVEAAFARVLRDNPDITYIAVSDREGAPLAVQGDAVAVTRLPAPVASGSPSFPVGAGIAPPLWVHRDHGQHFDNALGLRGGAILHIGVAQRYVDHLARDFWLDVASVLVVALLISFELLLLVVTWATARFRLLHRLATHLDRGELVAAAALPVPSRPDEVGWLVAWGRQAAAEITLRRAAVGERFTRLSRRDPEDAALAAAAQHFSAPLVPPPTRLAAETDPSSAIAAVRLGVFLFCFAEELTRPFLPGFLRGFADGAAVLSTDTLVGLPITLFMVAWAVSQPMGAALAQRLGARTTFLAGTALGGAGYMLSAGAVSYWALLGWRGVTGLGYGLVLIAAQTLIIARTRPEDRTSGLAQFIGGLLAAGICGPLTGGVIVEQIGPHFTLMLGAVLALFSAVLVLLALPGGRLDTSAAKTAPPVRLRLAAVARLAVNRQFLRVVLLSAVPTKIAATAFLFYLFPLFLADRGAFPSDIGRVQMLYFVAYIAVTPGAAWMADHWRRPVYLLALGGVLTAVACVPLLLSSHILVAAGVMAAFGAAQALIGAPQLALVTLSASRGDMPEAAVLAWFRLLERMGGALGPVVAAALAFYTSYGQAIVGIGAGCGLIALIFLSGASASDSPVPDSSVPDSPVPDSPPLPAGPMP